MGFHTHRVDHRVGAAAGGQRPDGVADAAVNRVEVDGVDAAQRGPRQPFRNPVDGDHPIPQVVGDTCAHVADRPQAEHRDATALGNVGVGDGLPRRGQYVRQVDESRIRRSLRHFDVGELRLRDSQVFGLAARHLAVQFRIPEQRCAFTVVAHLRGLALRIELLVAHVAVPTGDLERNDDAVTDRQPVDVAADLANDAHGFVPENVTLVHERSEHLVQVQIRSADVGRGDFDDGVGRRLDLGVGHRVDPDVPSAMPGNCLHARLPSPVATIDGAR